jgi:hypothetical protein
MEDHTGRVLRCPRLGDEIRFAYCEHEAGELPCRLVVRCWGAIFPVESYLRERLGADRWGRFCTQAPKDRMTTLLEIAAAAQARRKREKDPGEPQD